MRYITQKFLFSMLAAVAIVASGVTPLSPAAPAGASTGETCPTGTTANDFFWQRANGTGAQWPASSAAASSTVTNSGYSLTYPVGASGVSLTATITDPANRSEDGDNPLLAANNGITSNWDGPIYTKTNGSYGVDYLTAVMNSASADEKVTFEFSFTRPVLIPQFDIGDVDYTGQSAPGNDPLHDSFQDEVDLFAERGGNAVGFDITQGSPGTNQPVITGPNSVAGGPFNSTLNGNLQPTDAKGTVYLSAQSPVTSFGFDYSNGPDDAANDPAASGIPGIPNGATGVSNNHAIRISGFTVCVGTMTIGDTVFVDVDGDGVQDPGEGGIPDVTIELRDTDGNVVGTTTTDENGTYQFTQLPPGLDYVVDPDETTLPGGTTWTPTGDTHAGDTTEDGVSTVPLTGTSGSQNDVDFAYQPAPAAISGHVWSDPEDDSVIGAADTHIEGVTIELVDGNGDVVDTTTTDANGFYSFTGVAAGTYTVREVQPASFVDGGEVAGTNGASVGADDEISVTVNWGESSTDNDYFEVPQASIAGTVFVDPDDDGVQAAPADGIPSVEMTLTGTDSAGNPVTRTTNTNPDGTYSFENLRAGTYTVTETQPASYLDGQDIVGSEGGSAGPNDTLDGIVLGANTAATDYDFAELPRPSLSGSVVDEYGNPIPGVEITITGESDYTATVFTGEDGTYLFEDLPPGTYTVTETQPLGYGDISTTAGSGGGDDSVENEISEITLGGGDAITGYDFVEGFSTLAGTVYEDLDNDGVQDPGEPGIQGVEVTLTGTDDRGNSIDLTATTDENGDYLFEDLFSGTYTVTEAQPSGYDDGTDVEGTEGGTATNPGDAISTIALPGAVDATGYDFGEVRPGSIAGTVLDENGDPIEGVTVTLTGTNENGAIEPITATTDENGAYIFKGLLPGTYTVTETQPLAYGEVSTTAGSVGGDDSTQNIISGIVIDVGDAATGYDFVEGYASIAGTVYEDLDNDGVQDEGEPGIEGAEVTLTGIDDRGNPVDITVTTDENGDYLFEDLFSGEYVVTEAQPDGFSDGTDAEGSAGGTATNPGDEISEISLAPGYDAISYDFGEIRPGAIYGTVVDDNGDPIPGVTVTLTGVNDQGEISPIEMVTDENGDYTFDTLRPGTYTVTETNPSGYGDGSQDSPTGTTDVVNVISGIELGQDETLPDNDFVDTHSSIAGTVYEDLDNDGVQDEGEPGIEGVEVTLTGTDDRGNTIDLTATTDENGNYLFEDLFSGDYVVTEAQPAGYFDGTDAEGSEGGTATNPGDEISEISLPGGTDAVSYDFGEIRPSSISGTVLDEHGDPIQGVTVTLVGTDDRGDFGPVQVTTDENGAYSFDGLRPGTYTVTETQPNGYGQVSTTAGTAGGDDSTDDQVSGIVLGAGEDATDYDFVEGYSSINGVVYEDLDNDGFRDEGEPAIEGVEVTLTGTDDRGNTIDITATTDEAGRYRFEDLFSGDYTVTEAQPVGFGDGSDIAGSEGGTATNPGDEISEISLPAGVDAISYDFGEIRLGAISGTVVDDNGDPIPGVTVTLTGVDDQGEIAPIVVTTDENGNYSFEDLRPGTYTVTETNPNGYGPGSQESPTGTTDVVNVISGIELGQNETLPDNDFVDTHSSIAGTVYVDNNNNGVQDSGEPGIEGVEVTLTGTDDRGNTIDLTATTDENGNYLFEDLFSGDYVVTEAQPAAYGDGTDAEGTEGGTATNPGDEISEISLPGGVDATSYDFGEIRLGTISGTVVDDNGDPIPGVTVTLTGVNDQGDITPIVVTTDENGAYSFDGLRPGTYTVTETNPNGYGDGSQDSPTGTTDVVNVISGIEVGQGDDLPDNDFVDTHSSIAGTVFEDRDNDGVQDSGEPGIEGVEVTLTGTDDRGHTIDVTVTTDENGNYVFADLFSGDYTVTEAQPAPYGDGTDTEGTEGGTATNPGDEISEISLPAGVDATSYDFGEIRLGTISGTVVDDNGDPIPGVTVTLTGVNDQGDITPIVVTTDENGAYVYDGLRPGTYTVTETNPNGYGPGSQTSPTGTVDTVNVISGIELGQGDDLPDNDFVDTHSSIAGTVYVDSNNNGVQDSGEPGIEGAEVTLTGTDDRGNTIDLTATTDADGNYLFEDLFSGDYVVTEAQPGSYLDGTDVEGTVGGTATNPGDEISEISLPGGVDATSYDFGEVRPGAISGTVVDDNGDPIPGVTVTLTGVNDQGEFGPVSVTTDENGAYSFEDLRPGTYTVTETNPVGYGPGSQTSPTGTVDTVNVISGIELGQGDDLPDNDFVDTHSSIAGTVYFDRDEDGTQGADEPGIEGVTVRLTGTDDRGNTVDITVHTDADGNYLIEDLFSGDYTVTEVTPTGYNDSTDTEGSEGGTATNPGDEISAISLPAGTDATDYDFSEIGTSLSGTVFLDDDRDGSIGTDEEVRLGGVTIILLDGNGTEVARTITAEDGSYRFDGLVGGPYTVVEEQPDGYGSTTENTLDVVLPVTGLTDVNFGEDLGSIGDLVFADTDRDGQQDEGELGVAGVTVTLLDENGDEVATTVTAEDGSYLFDRLAPGTYSVVFVAPEEMSLTEPLQGDPATDSDPDWLTGRTGPVVLAIAEDGLVDRRSDIDAGVVEIVIDLSITGTVSDDVVEVGDEVTYVFTPTNESLVPVPGGARVELTFPPSIVPSDVVAPGWVVEVDGQTVILTRDEPLLPGEALPEITVLGTVVDDEGPFDVTASIGTLDGELETTMENNIDALDITVVPVEQPTPTPTPTPPVDNGTLARTGSNVLPLVGLGLGLILAGLVLVPLGRRRATR